MRYSIGSDRKTVALAQTLACAIDAAMAAGDFCEAERLVNAGLQTPNQPLRTEFAAQIGAKD